MSDGVKLGQCPILTIEMYLKKIEVHYWYTTEAATGGVL